MHGLGIAPIGKCLFWSGGHFWNVTLSSCQINNYIFRYNNKVNFPILQKAESIVNGSGDLNHNHQPDLNSLKQAVRIDLIWNLFLLSLSVCNGAKIKCHACCDSSNYKA